MEKHYIGGPYCQAGGTRDAPETHPNMVLVYLWEKENESYHVKCYVPAIEEANSGS